MPLDRTPVSAPILKVAAGFTLGLMLLGLVIHLRQEESLLAEVKTRERKTEEQALAANSQSGAS